MALVVIVVIVIVLAIVTAMVALKVVVTGGIFHPFQEPARFVQTDDGISLKPVISGVGMRR